ncbi:mRNA triphosphatase CET1 [Ceratobasidium sp. AG-I]|nr:mRNA triphosphatase CET1 [Ceratobasidium sp. AG-I]
MATGIHMPGFKGSPPQDTSDLFGDDDDEADTNSEPDDDFEEVTVPTGGAAQKPPPEVFNVDEDDEDEDEDEDDFVSSRVNKYAPVNEANESVSRAASSSNAPPTKRRRTETPPPKQTTLPARPGNGHLPANPATHANNPPAPPPPSGPYVPTFFNASAGRNERLAPSIIDSDPLDEFSQEVADWIHHFTQGLNPDHVEIEAKLGILIDKGSNARLGGLSLTECILPPNSPIDTRFESNMPLQAHKHYNGLLNKLVAQAVPGQPRVKYSHTKLVDDFYGDGHGEKTRVTRDEKTKQVVACVRKKRIANLEVHSPKQGVDWRISINLEEPAPAPNGQPALTRRKDRISYTHQAFKIDLTQVTSSHAGPNQQLLHELEIEFVSAAELLRHRARRAQMGPGVNPFDDLVRVFVNNVRIMARNSS